MTASSNSAINKTMQFIFAAETLKHSISKFHFNGAVKISKNRYLMD